MVQIHLLIIIKLWLCRSSGNIGLLRLSVWATCVNCWNGFEITIVTCSLLIMNTKIFLYSYSPVVSDSIIWHDRRDIKTWKLGNRECISICVYIITITCPVLAGWSPLRLSPMYNKHKYIAKGNQKAYLVIY